MGQYCVSNTLEETQMWGRNSGGNTLEETVGQYCGRNMLRRLRRGIETAVGTHLRRVRHGAETTHWRRFKCGAETVVATYWRRLRHGAKTVTATNWRQLRCGGGGGGEHLQQPTGGDSDMGRKLWWEHIGGD